MEENHQGIVRAEDVSSKVENTRNDEGLVNLEDQKQKLWEKYYNVKTEYFLFPYWANSIQLNHKHISFEIGNIVERTATSHLKLLKCCFYTIIFT